MPEIFEAPSRRIRVQNRLGPSLGYVEFPSSATVDIWDRES